MGIYYNLVCLENGKSIHLSKMNCDENNNLCFLGTYDKELKRNLTHQEINKFIAKFLIVHLGMAVALVPDYGMDKIDNMMDRYDEKHDGEKSFGANNVMTYNQVMGLEPLVSPFEDAENSDYISAMVIECIQMTLNRE